MEVVASWKWKWHWKLLKPFANNLLTDIKLSKTYLSEIVQLGRFLGKLLGPFMKIGLLSIKQMYLNSEIAVKFEKNGLKQKKCTSYS